MLSPDAKEIRSLQKPRTYICYCRSLLAQQLPQLGGICDAGCLFPSHLREVQLHELGRRSSLGLHKGADLVIRREESQLYAVVTPAIKQAPTLAMHEGSQSDQLSRTPNRYLELGLRVQLVPPSETVEVAMQKG